MAHGLPRMLTHERSLSHKTPSQKFNRGGSLVAVLGSESFQGAPTLGLLGVLGLLGPEPPYTP